MGSLGPTLTSSVIVKSYLYAQSFIEKWRELEESSTCMRLQVVICITGFLRRGGEHAAMVAVWRFLTHGSLRFYNPQSKQNENGAGPIRAVCIRLIE